MKKQEDIQYKYRVLKIDVHMKSELYLLGLRDAQKEAHKRLVLYTVTTLRPLYTQR